MALKHTAFLLAILSVLALATCLDVASTKVGNWRPIKNLKATAVIDIGKYAIDEHNKEAKTALKFEDIVSGENQVVAGMNYKLVIVALDGSASNQYEAVVYERSWEQYRNLTSFKKLN